MPTAFLVLLLTVLVFVPGVGFPGQEEKPTTRERYLEVRRELFRDAAEHRVGSDVELTEKERRLDRILRGLRRQEIERTGVDFPPAHHFHSVRGSIDESPLMPLLRRMPKGGILHVHPGALVDVDWVVRRATYREDCWVYRGPRSGGVVPGTLRFAEESPGRNWLSTVAERRLSRRPDAYDSGLAAGLSLGPEDPKGTFERVWPAFQACFARTGNLLADRAFMEAYFREALGDLADRHVQYVELRMPLGFTTDAEGATAPGAEVEILRRLREEVREEHPVFDFRIVYTWLRSASPEEVRRQLVAAIELQRRHPDLIRGFDLVGPEHQGRPTADFVPAMLDARRKAREAGVELPFVLHGGETNRFGDENLYDLLALGVERIGHGLQLLQEPVLLDLVEERGTAIEICPISNQLLGYVADLRNHPVIHFLERGLPVTISFDDPGVFGYDDVAYDWYEVFMVSGIGLAGLKEVARNSLEHSLLPAEEREIQIDAWEESWESWVDWCLSEDSG